ncbi:phosphoribosylamine--glycine ligase [Acuticoccus sp. I52.16.1]|uniref:phosphoribosylamine--glycine ligase n=1 Tax=Acuticoccus sp. I52.16.1 TaxID=2928472 RepID=UPI001FD58B4A|nr:phosphoribosylamine--glycine ligase [Acuticoccus sp. I52.16.1]UOM36246.1 phosphoribosylamine--glycine ligase [Acuticoccus sp. I52.16.1]
MSSPSAAPSGARVLIVGSGGREHALAAAVKRSPKVAYLAFAGGPNAGLATIAEAIDPAEIEAAAATMDLVVIGPEAPLAEGLADRLRAAGRRVFGPSAAAAQLESSKAYTKRVCEALGLPTAKAAIAETLDDALAAVAAMGAPLVVKADGLAAGKGVVIAETMDEATAAVRSAMDGAFGEAGHRVVIEEKLEGPEVSLFALSDGAVVREFASARDYKRAYDGDAGPNTGGMGAVSPAPGFTDALCEEAMATIVRPTLDWLAENGTPYVGVLYAGLMLTADGPKLIEYNVRFGDPECQIMWERVTSDPFELLYATAAGTLASAPLTVSDESAVGVVVAAEGYPGPVAKGEPIRGLDEVAAAGTAVFHSGTKPEGGEVLSNGGRVLTVVARGATPADARRDVYAALEHLDWPGGRMRRDIAS